MVVSDTLVGVVPENMIFYSGKEVNLSSGAPALQPFYGTVSYIYIYIYIT